MLGHLSNHFSGIVKRLRGHTRLTEAHIQETLRDIRIALLEADVALPVVKTFISEVQVRALGREVIGSLTPGQALIGVVNEELTKLMGVHNDALNLAAVPPAVILMAGLQGAGKTTSAAKLAKHLQDQKKKVLLVSVDVYRPAAIEQLKTLSDQLEVACFPSDTSSTPMDIALAALDDAKRHFYDVLIVDTAGRLAIDEAMMAEMRALHTTIQPVETLFVVDAMQGQDAVHVAKAFNDHLSLTGIILTKLDGDSRGGAALSVRQVTGKPIKFIGVSEKLSGLEPFYPDRMASRILGMGDVLSLIEDVQKTIDEEKASKMIKKVKSGKGFDLEDFKEQLQQMKQLGGVDALMDKLPSQLSQLASQHPQVSDENIKRSEGIINSMTFAERRYPDLIKASRKRRIAMGAGVQVQEVNRLLKQFEEAQKMMKMFSKNGMGKMMRAMQAMKGFFPGK